MAPESQRHDVFISYSSKDKNVADAIVSDLENHGIKCWYAPRDVLPGEGWAAAITEAIQAANIFVLVYTEESNRSHQVTNEVTLAVSAGKTIIPFRLSKSDMNGTLEYYLSSVHWLDAIDPPLGHNIEILRDKITSILRIDGALPAGQPTLSDFAKTAIADTPPAAAGFSTAPGSAGYSTAPGSAGYSTAPGSAGSGSGKKPGRGPLIGIAAAAVVACIAGFALFGGKSSKPAQDTPAPAQDTVMEQAEAAQEADAGAAANEQANDAAAADAQQQAAADDAQQEPAAETPAAEAPQGPADEAPQGPSADAQKAEAPQPAAEPIAPPDTSAKEQEVIADQVIIPDKALSYNGHHYYIYSDVKTNWNDAQENCKERGGYLAVINDSAENEKVYKYMVTMGYEQAFFGLIFSTAKDDWDYLYGDTSEFRNWGVNSAGVQEPNNATGGENHTQFDVNMSDGHWNDAKFGAVVRTPDGDLYKDRFTYICEWDQ